MLLRTYNVGEIVVTGVGVDKAATVTINCWNKSNIICVIRFFFMMAVVDISLILAKNVTQSFWLWNRSW